MGNLENCRVQNVENCTSLKCKIPTTVKMKLFNMKKSFKNHDPVKNLKNKKIDDVPHGIEPVIPGAHSW